MELSYPTARDAVLLHVEVAREFARGQERRLGTGLPHDLMVWYGRLAVSAERSGAKEDASGFWRRAIEVAANDGGRVTQDDVRKVLTDLEARWDARLSATGS